MAADSAQQPPDQSDLEKIAAILLRHRVEFLVVGGQAEVLMGSPRVTYDTDLCYCRTKEKFGQARGNAGRIKTDPSRRTA
jgi:hypothetical protein